MKIGMNLLLWLIHLEESHAPLMKEIKGYGYDGVEVPLNMGDASHYKKMKAMLDSEGLECTTISGQSPEASIISPDASIRQAGLDHLKWAVDMAQILDSRIIGGPVYAPHKLFAGRGPTEDELKWCAENLKIACEYAKQANVQFSLEFLNRFEIYLLNTVEQCVKLMEMVDHPNLGIHYDTHHANIEENDPVSAIKLGGKGINHVHFSENNRGTLGTGQINFEAQFEAIKSIGYDDWVTVEIFGQSVQALVDGANVHRECFENASQATEDSFNYVKTFIK